MSEPCDKFKRVPESPGGLDCECGHPIYNHADGTYEIKIVRNEPKKKLPVKGESNG